LARASAIAFALRERLVHGDLASVHGRGVCDRIEDDHRTGESRVLDSVVKEVLVRHQLQGGDAAHVEVGRVDPACEDSSVGRSVHVVDPGDQLVGVVGVVGVVVNQRDELSEDAGDY
jgi:hypothetical protein